MLHCLALTVAVLTAIAMQPAPTPAPAPAHMPKMYVPNLLHSNRATEYHSFQVWPSILETALRTGEAVVVTDSMFDEDGQMLEPYGFGFRTWAEARAAMCIASEPAAEPETEPEAESEPEPVPVRR